MPTALLLSAALLAPQLQPPPGYELLRAARSFILVERWEDAIAAAKSYEERFPDGNRIGEARYLGHKARLFKILDAAADDPPLRTAAPMIKELTALAGEPLDDAVAAAKIALGTVQYLATSQRRPEAMVTQGLRDWMTIDLARPPVAEVPLALERDVTAIRDLVFQPYGRGLYANDPRWRFVAWASPAAPYLFLNPTVRVLIVDDGRWRRVTTYDRVPGHPRVLFVDYERRMLIDRIMLRLATLRPRSWMRRGAKVDVLALWSKAGFGARGRAGGWVFETHPLIVHIRFEDPQRTRARVRVIVGDTEGTVWLQKRDGVWGATR